MKQNDFYEVDGCTDFIPVKLIEEHKHMTNTLEVELTQTGYKTFVPIIYSFPKINEPKKPVVPKHVVDWVDDSRGYRFDFDEWFNCENQPKTVQLWLNPENKRQAELNALALVTLIVNGANAVEIEQEKLYTVEIRGVTHGRLFKNIHTNTYLLHSGDGLEGYTDKLTEIEIRQANEYLWQFAKEVE